MKTGRHGGMRRLLVAGVAVVLLAGCAKTIMALYDVSLLLLNSAVCCFTRNSLKGSAVP